MLRINQLHGFWARQGSASGGDLQSLLLDGAEDYIKTGPSEDFHFGTGTFTLEGWFRFSGTPTDCCLFGYWINGWFWGFIGGDLLFRNYPSTDGGSYTFSPTLNQWYHIACDRDGSDNLRIYVDGVMVGKTTSYNHDILDSSGFDLGIGSLRTGGFGIFDMAGWMDEIRITKGVARYASDGGFVLPTAKYPRAAPADADFASVVLLMGFGNAPDGSQVFLDESPSAHTIDFNGNAQIDSAQYKF